MAACAVATGWFPLLSIDALPSKSYNEGWNAYRQWMTLHGEPLYGVRGAFWTTNYGFLSFHIVGLLGAVIGNIVLAGRLVSFGSLVAVCGLVGAIVQRAGASRPAALYIVMALFAALCSFDSEGRAVNDPEMLSALFATLGLFAFMAMPRQPARLALAAAAFTLSLFTKHDYIAFPLSVALFLFWTRNWRGLLAFLATSLVSVAGLLVLSFWIDGPYALADLLRPRAYLLPPLLFASLHYLLHLAAPLVVAVLILFGGSAGKDRIFLLILLFCSNVFAIAFAGGDGVANNVFYPPIIADLLACGIAICLLYRRDRRLFLIALACSTFGLMVTVPSRVYFDTAAMLRLPADTSATKQAIAFLKASNGPAICEDLLLCYHAGKAPGYDPFYVKDQILIGRLQDASIVTLIDARRYGAIQLRGGFQGRWRNRMKLRFTPAFQQALMAAYHPVLVNRFYVLFVPATPP